MTAVLKALSISQITVSPYHPQANGMIERLNGTIKKAIKKAGATERTWDKWLHFVLHAIRITDHSATGHTPYELLFGRKPNTPISSLRQALEGTKEDLPQTTLLSCIIPWQELKQQLNLLNAKLNRHLRLTKTPGTKPKHLYYNLEPQFSALSLAKKRTLCYLARSLYH